MAKSARASSTKKNNQRLKKNVFGPVETARNDRLSAKLLELANQPKPPRTEMEVDGNAQDSAKKDKATDEDIDMDADVSTTKSTVRSNTALRKQREAKSARVDKKRHRRVRNAITFNFRHVKSKKGKKS